MPKTKERPSTLAKKERVRAAEDLRGVPKGTNGRVMMVTGLSWLRYWVRFDNGVEMGQLHRDKLVRRDEWDQWLIDEARRAELEAEAAQRRAAGGAPTPDQSPADGDAGSGTDAPGGVASRVPAHLLERSKAARQRLGA